ncbi:MAG: hypothetical protein LBB60_01635 [Desulfovibrio sp.]|jgi:hypothetical protein|nr:hypothetical protein [Desulfovibrio sp.]
MAKTINLTDDWYSSNYPDKCTITTKGDCQVQLGGMETGSKYTGGTGKDTVTILTHQINIAKKGIFDILRIWKTN